MSRSFLLLPLAVLLPACYVGPMFKIVDEAKRTCDADFLDWGGGLTHHVLQGRGDGLFDYEPENPLIERIEGQYDLESGDFHWTATHAEGGFRLEEEAEGYGTLWRDGDLEVIYDLVVRYEDETERTWEVHTERYGCVETTRSESDRGRVEIVEATWGDDAVSWVRDWIWGPVAISGEGSRNKLGESSESGKVSRKGDLSYQYSQSTDVQGRTVHTFEGHDGVREVAGSWQIDRKGIFEADYTSRAERQDVQTWRYTVDGTGAGEGTWTWGEDRCDLKFRKFHCERRNCNDEALEGRCQPPVDFPDL